MLLHMQNYFDPEANFEVHRRNLPHWSQDGTTYFVTFHLADSLPGRKLAAFREQKKRWLTLNQPPHHERQIQEFRRNFTERIDRWLDAGHGSCILASPQIHQVVKNALTFFDGERYSLGEHVIMPNHVHALVTPLNDHNLNRVVHSWKSFSAKQINRIASSQGPVWHQESFDHIVRNPAQLIRIQEYIRDNPKCLHGNAR
jgi:REP element-mobilizing transposase RayT